MDFYQAQSKYRQKQLRFILLFVFRLSLIFLAILIGWRFGNSDKIVLIQENERITHQYENSQIAREKALTDIRLKLKEANLALEINNIRDSKSNFGKNAKNLLAYTLASGVKEETIINSMKQLSKLKICNNYISKELSVSTSNFIPPQNMLSLFSGGLKIKAVSNKISENDNNPYFNPDNPLKIKFIYLGNSDIVEGILPLKKDISAENFLVKIKLIKSEVRGAILVKYKTCKV